MEPWREVEHGTSAQRIVTRASTRLREVRRHWLEIVVAVLVVALLAYVAYLAVSSSNCGASDQVATASNPNCASAAPAP
jgi:hypothetical protein